MRHRCSSNSRDGHSRTHDTREGSSQEHLHAACINSTPAPNLPSPEPTPFEPSWGRSLAYCTFYYTDEASRLLTDTTKKIDTQRFQAAAVMSMSVPGLPIRDCAERCNSSVPRCAKVSTIEVMKKTIFERFYLVQGLGKLDL